MTISGTFYVQQIFMYQGYDIQKNRKAHCSSASPVERPRFAYLQAVCLWVCNFIFWRGQVAGGSSCHLQVSCRLECPRFAYLRAVCLWVCDFTWRNRRLPSPPQINSWVRPSVCRYRTYNTAYWLMNYCPSGSLRLILCSYFSVSKIQSWSILVLN